MDNRIEKALELLNAFKVCIDEHPIVENWVVEIINRKDGPFILGKHADITITDEYNPFDLSIGEWIKEQDKS